MKVIDLGNFDINQLPKLHREESTCNYHLTKASERFQISLDSSKLELITTRIKLQSTFPNLQFFLNAWQIYVFMRTRYHSKYNSSLIFWIERLVYRAFIH